MPGIANSFSSLAAFSSNEPREQNLVGIMATGLHLPARLALLVALAWAGTLYAQESPASNLPASFYGGSGNSNGVPCVQPQPIMRLQDYDGPFGKTVGLFASQLQRKSVRRPLHFKPGLLLCSLELKDKFQLFIRGSIHPVSFLDAGFNAGISQANNGDRAFGQGMAGYGKRFGANYADEASFRFFKDFAYPSIFAEDPRYYPLARGSGAKRFLHAMEHVIVAHRDNGSHMFNFSEWIGTTSATSLSNLYHPGNQRGFASTSRGVIYNVVGDMGFDVLREFWPEISFKFDFPFRGEPTTQGLDPNAALK